MTMHTVLVQNARLPILLAVAGLSMSTGAFAQQPTKAQIGAIRSSCRADYPLHCAGVPTGGAAALQCLKKNVADSSHVENPFPRNHATAIILPPAAPKHVDTGGVR